MSKDKNEKQSVLVLWGPVILWYSIMFYLSHQPNLKSGLSYDFLLRKCAHIFEFTVLGFLIFNTAWRSNWFKGKKELRVIYSILIAFFIAISLAISDEIHQTYVRGRNGTYTDVMIDSIGIMISGIIIKIRSFKTLR